MKPIRNRYYCTGCRHCKMLFETRKEAIRFIDYNADVIERETGKRPARAYYCKDCGGWHVTSSRHAHDHKSIIRRFGEEKGAEISGKIAEICKKCRNVEEGLLLRIRELRHLLKFKHIDADRCCDKIQQIIEYFEIVIIYGFGEQTSIDKLIDKFKKVCSLFNQKIQLACQRAIATKKAKMNASPLVDESRKFGVIRYAVLGNDSSIHPIY